jgi:hypothetical protein
MDTAKRLEEYLVKAKEADEHAARCRDEYSRKAWKALADGYRYLAGDNGASKNEI